MSLKDTIKKSAHAAGKSFKTRDARIMHVKWFANYLQMKNIQINPLIELFINDDKFTSRRKIL